VNVTSLARESVRPLVRSFVKDVSSVAPPPVDSHILTEDGRIITTEGGDELIVEP
jgi:hypothetical protein